jgi:hypothetical protein
MADARRLIRAWDFRRLRFAPGTAYTYTLGEKLRLRAGNFLWGAYSTLFILFFFRHTSFEAEPGWGSDASSPDTRNTVSACSCDAPGERDFHASAVLAVVSSKVPDLT